eukprot:TRINITY_DN4540_c0_g2_i1.p1 TRINITY_DN4540_c0_g2~~TRINITY_DN4540_c0_g2_i1.p1  ORF type:complete len:192 (+),score=47.26 TRINITY_DN4540_c0_g2_i1:120-695(+)
MSKVPNFYKFRSNGSNIVTNEAKKGHATWHLHYIDCYIPEDGGFTITIRVHKIVKFSNSFGINFGIVETNENNRSTFLSYDNTHNISNYICSRSRFPKGIGYFAIEGVFYNYSTVKNIGVPYGEGDEVKMNIYKNKTIEFFKNNESIKIFDLQSFSILPLVSLSSTSEVEIINISSLDDEEAEQSSTNNNN